MLSRALLAIFMLLGTGFAQAQQTIIVLDASGSMWGQIDGKTKIEIAREALDPVLKAVPPGNALGLIVYGHREKGSCGDIELAVPPGPGTSEAISRFVHAINPKGKTPLSASVRQAAEALKYTEDKATVILVTDGLETCEADPCALAQELEKDGIDFTAHVVGFGLTDEEGKQVACLAENTGGKYLQAKDAGELSTALTETVAAEPAPAPPPPPVEPAKPEFNTMTDAVLSEGGPSMGDSDRVRWDFYTPDANGEPSGDAVDGAYGAVTGFNLQPGKYIGEARLGGLQMKVAFEVTEGSVATPMINFDAGLLTVVPKRTPEDTGPDDSARVDATFGGGDDGGYGRTEMYVSAGNVEITGRIGPASVTETITIAAGETKIHEMVIGTGIIVTKAIYAEGGPEVDSDAIRFDVFTTKKDINGNRKDVNGSYGTNRELDIPAGEFILVGRLGEATGEVPFSVKAGERLDVVVNINGGVLAIAAPGAYRIDVVEAKKDIQGRQKDVTGGYGEALQETVPPGDYLVNVTYEGDKAPAQAPATVKAGERTELTVD